MTTKRARNHKDLVEFEKKYHHGAGRRFYRHSKTRWSNLTGAVLAESFYEWHNRGEQYPELAQKLAELDPLSIVLDTKSELVRELLEALNHD